MSKLFNFRERLLNDGCWIGFYRNFFMYIYFIFIILFLIINYFSKQKVLYFIRKPEINFICKYLNYYFKKKNCLFYYVIFLCESLFVYSIFLDNLYYFKVFLFLKENSHKLKYFKNIKFSLDSQKKIRILEKICLILSIWHN